MQRNETKEPHAAIYHQIYKNQKNFVKKGGTTIQIVGKRKF